MSKDNLHDVQTRLVQDNDDQNMTLQTAQHISKSFLDSIRAQKDDSMGYKEGEYMSVARVPAAVHEQWLREGFDMMVEPAHAIVARLKQQNLDAFLTSKKQV